MSPGKYYNFYFNYEDCRFLCKVNILKIFFKSRNILNQISQQLNGKAYGTFDRSCREGERKQGDSIVCRYRAEEIGRIVGIEQRNQGGSVRSSGRVLQFEQPVYIKTTLFTPLIVDSNSFLPLLPNYNRLLIQLSTKLDTVKV